MAEFKDSVKDQSTSTGTGAIIVTGAPIAGFLSIAEAHTDGATLNYRISNADQSEWEIGRGVWSASTSTLTRDKVFASSNAKSLVAFSAGTKTVITTVVADDLRTIGEIKAFSGTTIPDGYLACEGQLLAVSSYPLLFAVIGSAYGGNGTTTFALPSYRNPGAGARRIMCVDYHPNPPVQQVTVPTSIQGSAPGIYYAGDALSFTVQFLNDIAVSGGPATLSLSIGGASPHSLSFVSGTAREWTFSSYTLSAGEVGDVSVSINLNGATLSSAGISAVLSMSHIPSGVVAAVPLAGSATDTSSATGNLT